jgi:predicted ATPase
MFCPLRCRIPASRMLARAPADHDNRWRHSELGASARGLLTRLRSGVARLRLPNSAVAASYARFPRVVSMTRLDSPAAASFGRLSGRHGRRRGRSRSLVTVN